MFMCFRLKSRHAQVVISLCVFAAPMLIESEAAAQLPAVVKTNPPSGGTTNGGGIYASAVATSGRTAWVVNKKTGSGLTQIGQTTPSFLGITAPVVTPVAAGHVGP